MEISMPELGPEWTRDLGVQNRRYVRNRVPIKEPREKSQVRALKAILGAPPNRRPLRICMVSYTFYETDSRVMRYAEALAQRGDEVEVFALRRQGTPHSEVSRGVRVRRIQGRLFNEKSRFSYLWRILLFLARALYQVSLFDLRQKYDLVHVHSVPDFLVFAALVPR